MDTTTLDLTTVAAAAKAGDPRAFEILVRVYQRRAYGVAYSFVGNRDDAMDLAQEAFARAYRAMARFHAGAEFYPWLHRILRNLCLNHLRKRRRRGEISLDALVENGRDFAERGGDPDIRAGRTELSAAFTQALAALGPEHREIIALRHFQELSYAEIAACLRIPQGTVMSRLHAARRALRSRLEPLLTDGTDGRGRADPPPQCEQVTSCRTTTTI